MGYSLEFLRKLPNTLKLSSSTTRPSFIHIVVRKPRSSLSGTRSSLSRTLQFWGQKHKLLISKAIGRVSPKLKLVWTKFHLFGCVFSQTYLLCLNSDLGKFAKLLKSSNTSNWIHLIWLLRNKVISSIITRYPREKWLWPFLDA